MQTIEQLPARQIRAVAIAAAIVVNVVVLLIARIVNGAYPVATLSGEDQTVGIVRTVIVTATVGLLGWGLLELLERRTRKPLSTWQTIAVVATLVSLLAPIGSAVDTPSMVALICLHIATAATIIPLMGRNAAS